MYSFIILKTPKYIIKKIITIPLSKRFALNIFPPYYSYIFFVT